MKLEESTFTLYAIKYYDNPHCNSIEEYEDDVKRIKHIKKLISKYKQSGEINERLLLNHLIVFYNCFRIPRIKWPKIFISVGFSIFKVWEIFKHLV